MEIRDFYNQNKTVILEDTRIKIENGNRNKMAIISSLRKNKRGTQKIILKSPKNTEIRTQIHSSLLTQFIDFTNNRYEYFELSENISQRTLSVVSNEDNLSENFDEETKVLTFGSFKEFSKNWQLFSELVFIPFINEISLNKYTNDFLR